MATIRRLANRWPTDARPNRVLDPLRQADRSDPEGEYVRRYVPELSGVDDKYVHRPWELPVKGYPPPIVDLAEARSRFLAARG